MTTLSPGVHEDYSDWPSSATRFWVAKLAPIKYEKSFVPRVSRRRNFRKSTIYCPSSQKKKQQQQQQQRKKSTAMMGCQLLINVHKRSKKSRKTFVICFKDHDLKITVEANATKVNFLDAPWTSKAVNIIPLPNMETSHCSSTINSTTHLQS